jgi:putative oxidoreductase
VRARIAIALRILLGLVFCYAAYVKLREPWLYFAASISSYQLLPDWAVFALARTLPWTELVVGVVLLSGRLLKVAAPGASLLLAVFYAAMLRAYAAGAGIDCACFGPGDTIGPWTLARDGALLGCSLVLTVLVLRLRKQTLLPSGGVA